MAVLEIIRGDSVVRVPAAEGTLLSQALLDHQCAPDMPCGGHRRCRKCRVTAFGNLAAVTEEEREALSPDERAAGVRLACCTRILGDARVCIHVLAPDDHICSDGVDLALEGDSAFSVLGAAVDVGTTTLAARLYDHTGLLATATAENPQRIFGADVISRIEQAMSGKAEQLAAVIRQAVDGLLVRMCAEASRTPQEIDGLVIAGNTAMLCLLTGEDVSSMSSAPFVSRELFGKHVFAETLRLSCAPGAQVYLPRCMSAFIGADITSALLASGICSRSKTALLADIGTNGEIALWHQGKLTCCSTAAGPAFEGANLSQGMPGGNGAIDHVQVRNGRLDVHVVGDCTAAGICGSGVADTLACLLQTGEMSRSGRLVNGERYKLTASVSLTQTDIRQVQLAKGAIRAGIETLLHYTGLQAEDIDLLAIAGGFGSYLSLDSAAGIGLFPPELTACTHVLGNAALSGASMLLWGRHLRILCDQIADGADILELATDPFFMETYIESMLF